MDEMAGTPRDRGRKYPMPARKDDQARTIARMLCAHKLPAEAMLDGRFTLEKDEQCAPQLPGAEPGPVTAILKWCDRPTKRVMVKIALELLAYFEHAKAGGIELFGARRFARYDEGDLWAGVDTETRASGLEKIDAPLIHGIELWTSGQAMFYRMVLFSELCFAGLLAEAWHADPFRAMYTFDVRSPRNMIIRSDPSDGARLVRKSYRVRQREFDEACLRVRARSLAQSKRQWTQAPMPDLTELYPLVVKLMRKM